MRLFLLCLIPCMLISCGKKEKPAEISEADMQQQQTLADSLQAVADSIEGVKRLHAMYQGQHVHTSGDNLAAVAHQDPELDRQIKRSIRDNRQRQLDVYNEQNQKMFEQLQQQRKTVDSTSEEQSE